MTKYLIDASIIASSQEDFQRRFVSPDSILVLSNLTFTELEARKVDSHCCIETKKFVRYLIDLFVRDKSTEICTIKSSSKHVDEKLVEYAKENNMSIITCDKGMALHCRFLDVPCELLESRVVVELPFVFAKGNALYVNLFDHTIPKGYTVFAYSTTSNKTLPPLGNGIIFLNPGNILLVAHTENGICGIDTYYINNDVELNLISKNIYSTEGDINVESNPFHKELYKKWVSYMKKHI